VQGGSVVVVGGGESHSGLNTVIVIESFPNGKEIIVIIVFIVSDGDVTVVVGGTVIGDGDGTVVIRGAVVVVDTGIRTDYGEALFLIFAFNIASSTLISIHVNTGIITRVHCVMSKGSGITSEDNMGVQSGWVRRQLMRSGITGIRIVRIRIRAEDDGARTSNDWGRKEGAADFWAAGN